MGLPRAFVGFSSSDIHYFRLMQAWKSNSKFDFNFTDCQLLKPINSQNEVYIKSLLRERINMAGTFISLIGEDTKDKGNFVDWEIEIAKEKKCRLIGVNLNGSRRMDNKCPYPLRNSGAIFIPFSPKIVAYVLENYQRNISADWYYPDELYKKLGYLDG